MGKDSRERAKRRVEKAARAREEADHQAMMIEIAAELDAAGISAKVAAVDYLMRSRPFQRARHEAFFEADESDAPPKNEEDVRQILLGVLASFRADMADVLLKVTVLQGSIKVRATSGVEVTRAAVELVKARRAAAGQARAA